MITRSRRRRRPSHVLFTALAVAAVLAVPAVSSAQANGAVVQGPIPGAVPGDPASPVLSETYPFFSTWQDLARSQYVEQEYYVSGVADAYSTAGVKLASNVPYRTRIVVRRPMSNVRFNGTVLVEWQNVTAGYDLDALWNRRHLREGYAWVGVSAQRVGVDQLRGWSPTRYGSLDVTGGGVSWETSSPTTSSPRPPRRCARRARSIRCGGSTSNASSRSAPPSQPAG